MDIEQRLVSLENKVKKLDERIEMMILEKHELIGNVNDLSARLSELEDDHISLLLHGCVCNNDGGDNGACESKIHYCICDKLKHKTFDCRAKAFVQGSSGHKCVCPYEVRNGIECRTDVTWCREHSDLHDIDLSDVSEPMLVIDGEKELIPVHRPIHHIKQPVINDFNPKQFMKHFIARLTK
jgi:hypothetical protein